MIEGCVVLGVAWVVGLGVLGTYVEAVIFAAETVEQKMSVDLEETILADGDIVEYEKM